LVSANHTIVHIVHEKNILSAVGQILAVFGEYDVELPAGQ